LAAAQRRKKARKASSIMPVAKKRDLKGAYQVAMVVDREAVMTCSRVVMAMYVLRVCCVLEVRD
jgi:hypothetical protein